MKNIENIIFDFGGVLFDIDFNLTRSAFEKLGVVDFDQMYSQANADTLFQNLETGHISEENFYTELNNCTGLQLSPEQIRNAWNDLLLQYRELSIEYLTRLTTNYNLYLFSNTNFIHKEAFTKIYNEKPRPHSFDVYFTKAYYSCEMGLRKPDAASFQWIIDDLKINPEKTLFIDDTIPNIEAAKALGLQTILLKPGEKIEDLGLLG